MSRLIKAVIFAQRCKILHVGKIFDDIHKLYDILDITSNKFNRIIISSNIIASTSFRRSVPVTYGQ